MRDALLPLLIVFLMLPYVLTPLYRFINPPSTLMMSDAFMGKTVSLYWVSIDRIPHHVIRTVIAAEDGRFCTHHGIDFEALRKVIRPLSEGNLPSRGASTITMQVAKNLFLWHDKSLVRKALEAPVALWIDAVWSKKRVLEVYLNIAEWGQGIYGIEAASRKYFGISASALNPYQAQLLVAALPNPIERNPARPQGYVRQIAQELGARVAHQGAQSTCVR